MYINKFIDGNINFIKKITRNQNDKRGGVSVMPWGCFTASGSRDLDHITGYMKFDDYKGILDQYLLHSVR